MCKNKIRVVYIFKLVLRPQMYLRSCDGCSAAVLRARGDLSGTLDNVGQSKLFLDHKDQ